MTLSNGEINLIEDPNVALQLEIAGVGVVNFPPRGEKSQRDCKTFERKLSDRNGEPYITTTYDMKHYSEWVEVQDPDKVDAVNDNNFDGVYTETIRVKDILHFCAIRLR